MKQANTLCFHEPHLNQLFIFVPSELSSTFLYMNMRPHSEMISYAFRWFCIYIYAIADDVMIQHFMLHLQRPIIFNINILYAPRRFLSVGSIYRQLKCKTLPIDFIFFSLYWLLLFIHSKKAIRLVLKRIEFEVQRNSFDRYWKEKTLNKHSNESTEMLLLTYKRNSISLYISISSYQ